MALSHGNTRKGRVRIVHVLAAFIAGIYLVNNGYLAKNVSQFMHNSSEAATFNATSSSGSGNNETRVSLLRIFNDTSFQMVKHNNWDMGCNDLAIAASYYRAISDRLYKGNAGKLLIFDIGANNGQDAANVFGTFHKIEGMCQGYNIPYLLISIEPSPKVFCELLDVACNPKGMEREPTLQFPEFGSIRFNRKSQIQ